MNLFAIVSDEGRPGDPTGLEHLDARLLADIGYAADGTPLLEGRRPVLKRSVEGRLSDLLDAGIQPILRAVGAL